ncbi:MAG TPA: hypothetical protein VJC18_05800, partial [bacterium]|nr:hypothetical protein [bacterium]
TGVYHPDRLYRFPFPAHAGMNRLIVIAGTDIYSVPRTRGDEPITGFFEVGQLCRAPHMRS